MAAVAELDGLRKNTEFVGQSFNWRGLFYTKLVGASTASGASFASTVPFAFGALFRNGWSHYDYSHGGEEDYFSVIRGASRYGYNIALTYSTTKQYNIELKPLFAAFHWRNLALTSLRSFSLFYSSLMNYQLRMELDAGRDLPRASIDWIVPLKYSVAQIMREISIVTMRRVLERLAVDYVSQRVASKLVKDVATSAVRKAGRRIPTFTYIFDVSRTTFRGHVLGVLAPLIIQVGVDIYRFFTSILKTRNAAEKAEQVGILVKKVYVASIMCGASLVFASVGAGIGARLLGPSTGQRIGCAVGNTMGPVFVVSLIRRNESMDL